MYCIGFQLCTWVLESLNQYFLGDFLGTWNKWCSGGLCDISLNRRLLDLRCPGVPGLLDIEKPPVEACSPTYEVLTEIVLNQDNRLHFMSAKTAEKCQTYSKIKMKYCRVAHCHTVSEVRLGIWISIWFDRLIWFFHCPALIFGESSKVSGQRSPPPLLLKPGLHLATDLLSRLSVKNTLQKWSRNKTAQI